MKHVTIEKLWNKKDCYGWCWAVKGKKGHYIWHNDNDLGLLAIDTDYLPKETISRKIEVSKGNYLYVLRNKWNYHISDFEDETNTLPQIKAVLKDCHREELTKHERMLTKRVWGY